MNQLIAFINKEAQKAKDYGDTKTYNVCISIIEMIFKEKSLFDIGFTDSHGSPIRLGDEVKFIKGENAIFRKIVYENGSVLAKNNNESDSLNGMINYYESEVIK